jgi:hypothetical protein
VQQRRKENEILATDQRHLYVRSTREPFVEVHCRVKPGKSAAGYDYSSRLHAITAKSIDRSEGSRSPSCGFADYCLRL